jgi:hypothetical protein
MQGQDQRTGELFSYVDLEKRVPAEHPLRLVRSVVNEVLAALDRIFLEITRTAAELRSRLSDCRGRFCSSAAPRRPGRLRCTRCRRRGTATESLLCLSSLVSLM